jgi:23S rRNA (cytidine2498-2'-O)-methyltransferase
MDIGRIVNSDNFIITTTQPEFTQVAITELQQLDPHLKQRKELLPGMILCETEQATYLMRKAARERPCFVRHLAPSQTVIQLQNTEQDLGEIATALATLTSFSLLEKGIHFAVQSRIIHTDKNLPKQPYSSGTLNKMLAEAVAEETGAIESIKKPQIVISIFCTSHQSYIGISPVEENLSSWPGGARHFAQTNEQISRAEFKLLEALDVFGISLPSNGTALDLGAAPGGWTRLLLEAGLSVTAVDPAKLDSRLEGNPHLQHYRGYAEDFIKEAIRKASRFDIIVNDMRMDAREAARLLVYATQCLKREGFLISVLKLPHATQTINPLKTLKEALNILQKRYDLVQAKQLFHNRQEVTIMAAYPRPTRR